MIKNQKFRKLFIDELTKRNIPNLDLNKFENFTIDTHAEGYKENLYPKIEEMLKMHPLSEIVDMFLHGYSNIEPSVLKYTYTLRRFDDVDIENFKTKIGRDHTPCYAPLRSLDFHINGSISICCYTKSYPVGSYPKDTIKDVWFGKALKTFRENLKNFDFPNPCTRCVKQVISGYKDNSILDLYENKALDAIIPDNVNPVLFKKYPHIFKNHYPTMFTFQLSDVCNYECIMCGGAWSSSIRKNREKLPAINMVYDDNFVEQLKEFIPHLKKIYFVGGEPFMASINYKIMDLIAELNPLATVFVTTNASVLNTRVKDIIKKLPNLKIIASVDSINPKTYAFIRKNGNLEQVMENLKYFISENRLEALTVCPMIQNIYEIPEIIEFCDKNDIGCWFNIVEFPLGGYVKGIHEFPKMDIKEYYTLSTSEIYTENQTIQVNLEEKLPLMPFNTLPIEEKVKIKNFLESKTYNFKNTSFKGKIDSLVQQIISS